MNGTGAKISLRGVQVACHAVEEGRLQTEWRSAERQQVLASEQL